MNLLETILSAQGGGAVRQIGTQFGLDESQTRSVIEQLTPALARGLQRNAGSGDGLGSLLGALASGNHQRYLEDPEALAGQGALEGNGILGHIFGSKDVSRNVAGRAARETGVSSDVIKQMLPIVASMAMAALSRQAGQQGVVRDSAPPRQDDSAMGMLNSFLDADKDGSAVDDIINLAQKFF